MRNKYLSLVIILIIILGGIFLYRSQINKIVQDKPDPVLAQMPAVSEFSKRAYQTQLDDIKKLAQLNPIKAWDYLKSAFLVNGQVIGNAHQMAHLVGNAMLDKYGLNGITNCDQTFAFGCYHGASEKLLQDQGVDAVLQVQSRCIEIFPPAKDQNYTGCIHGMGHGLLTWEKRDVNKALIDCDKLDNLYRNFCYDGVFMERSNELTEADFDPKDPWKFCTELNSSYHYNCARYQSQVFLNSNNYSVPKAGEDCAKAKQEILATTCFESLGYHVTQRNLGDQVKILEICNQISGDGKFHCIIGSTREVTFQRYVDWQKTSQALCNSLPVNWRDKCQK